MSRYLSWFTTKNGKIFTRFCVGAAAFSAFATPIAIHGVFLERMQEVFQSYNYGEPQPLPPKVNGIIEQVLQDSTLKKEQKKKLKFFYVIGPELFHAGAIESPWGAIVGVPFIYEDIKDIKFNEMRILGKEKIDWIIDGQDLIKAMTISDDAKKFALLREIYSCRFSDIFTNAVLGAGAVMFSAKLSQNINTRTNALEKLLFRQRCVRYCIFYIIGYMFYRLFKDPLKHIADKESDKLAAEAGIDYLNGGIEFYKKTLMKNKALREISESKFKRVYDEHGNENYFLLAPKLPVSKRLDYLRDLKQEKMGNVEESESSK